MADGTGGSEAYGQLLIKAGVPLAIGALAALFYVRKSSSLLDDHTVESTNTEIDIVEEAQNEVLSCLVDRINELQVKVEEVQARLERCQSMNDHEWMVIELQNMLQLEMVRGDYLEKEVSSKESELRRMQELEMYGIHLFHQAENLKVENRRLKRNVKKFLKKWKQGIRVNGAQRSRIQDMEDIIKRSCDEVEKGIQVVNKMRDEIYEFQGLVEELRTEKMELSEKLKAAEDSLTLKNESEIKRMEECKEKRNELEKLQEEFSTEGVELVQLRWANALLRRRLIQRDALNKVAPASDGENALLELDLHYELDKIANKGECSSSSSEVTTNKKSVTKKPVEDSHQLNSMMSDVKADNGNVNSHGRHYSWDWVEEHVHGHGRKYFSSGSI